MVDKEQVIIDGVDVSGCDNNSPQGNCITYGNTPCDCFPDCHFKQLQRSVTRIKDLEERIIGYAKTVEEYCSRLADKNKKCEKYEQALNEIRNIIASGDVGTRPKLYDFEQDSKILDIISKVKEERITKED